MSDYIVFENIPNTPEGRKFLKDLRKYLRPQYKLRSRGRHSDRKGLAEQLVKQGVYCDADDSRVQDRAARVHDKLRAGMSCKYAERITTVVEARNEQGIQWRNTGGQRGFYVRVAYHGEHEWQGPFKKWEDAVAAQRVMKGTSK